MFEITGESLAPFKHASGLICARLALPKGDMAWLAATNAGCITFLAFPMPKVDDSMCHKVGENYWMAADVGRHTAKPVREYDKPSAEPCVFLDVPCYYDGSSLQAEAVLGRAIELDTEEVIWEELASYYEAWIGAI